MEEWLFFAIISTISSGVFWFLQKVEVESKTIHRDGFLLYAYASMVLISAVIMVFSWDYLELNLSVILPAFLLNFLYVIILKARLKSLSYITTSSYYINYRIFTSSILLFLGQIIFSEQINLQEYIGIFLGFIIFYLLLEKSSDNKKAWNVKKWYMYLAICTFLAVVSWVFQKFLVLHDLHILSYIFYSGLSGLIFTMLLRDRSKNTIELLKIKNMNDVWIYLVLISVFTTGVYWTLKALSLGWDVSIVYKVFSYSLFVTIILSMIFYKESITWKKILAFALTIISVWLFV